VSDACLSVCLSVTHVYCRHRHKATSIGRSLRDSNFSHQTYTQQMSLGRLLDVSPTWTYILSLFTWSHDQVNWRHLIFPIDGTDWSKIIRVIRFLTCYAFAMHGHVTQFASTSYSHRLLIYRNKLIADCIFWRSVQRLMLSRQLVITGPAAWSIWPLKI